MIEEKNAMTFNYEKIKRHCVFNLNPGKKNPTNFF